MKGKKSDYILFSVLVMTATICFCIALCWKPKMEQESAPPSVAVNNPYVPKETEPTVVEPVQREYEGNDMNTGSTESGVDEVINMDSDYRFPCEYSIIIAQFSDEFLSDLTVEGNAVKEAIMNVLSQYCKDIGCNADILHFDEVPKTQLDNHTVYNIRAAGSIIHVHVAGLDSVVACIE